MSDDTEWVALAGTAVARAGMDLMVTASPAEAMVRLAGVHDMCRLLLDVRTAGRAMTSLFEMTCGELSSGVDVIALGATMPGLHCVPAPDCDALLDALANPARVPATPRGEPPLDASQIARMMAEGGVHVRFQPIVAVEGRELVALEVLARLHRTTCSILPPHRFIPQLEEAGMGADLLRHVTEQAFAVQDRLGGARMALNLPLSLLKDGRTPQMLSVLREHAGVPAFRIMIELTETETVEDVEQLDPVVGRWRKAGYALAIDDAGPAVPRHRDMFDLPFEWVKLDKSVVREAERSRKARGEMADTVASAHRANIVVIAEGIETQATWDMIRELGVDCAQGFMVGRPMPADVVPVWRTAWEKGAGPFPA